jgi:hypothetical protein
MQSAYEEYRRASEALECAEQWADELSAVERSQLAALERQQRLTFERYLEARMTFLEVRFDETNQPRVDGAAVPVPGSESPKNRRVKEMVAAGLLFITVSCLVGEWRQVRKLEAGRDELKATLVKNQNDIQLLLNKPPAEPSPAPAARAATTDPKPRRQSVTDRSYYKFSLARSRQFKRVGPIEVAVRFVDTQRESVNLSIVSDSGKINMDRVKLRQPVWIKSGFNGQHLELVVDRISGTNLYGHLIQFRG